MFGIASFGAISLFASGDAAAHPGHAIHAADPETKLKASECIESHVSSPDDGAPIAARCLTVCCTGSGCCPPSLLSNDQVTLSFRTSTKLFGLRVAPAPDFAIEPLPEPPRSFI